jgi:DNA-binding IclR family transcriptional regulator
VASRPRKQARKRRRQAGGDKIVTAVDRAARVLAAFADSWDFATLPDVARRAKLSKPTTFRILATLAAEGLIFQNEANSTYGLGFLALRLADVVLGSIRLRESARPSMRHIRDSVNETVVLGLLQGDYYCNVDSLEGTHLIGQTQLIGAPIPLYVGAPGQALLAGMSDEAVSAYIRRVRPEFLHKAGMTRAKLLREIGHIRRRGYAISSGDIMHGGHTIAAAIPSREDAAVATLHISFPQGRYSNQLEDRCVKALMTGASRIGDYQPEVAKRGSRVERGH